MVEAWLDSDAYMMAANQPMGRWQVVTSCSLPLFVTDKLTPQYSHSSGPNVVEFGEEAYSFQYF